MFASATHSLALGDGGGVGNGEGSLLKPHPSKKVEHQDERGFRGASLGCDGSRSSQLSTGHRQGLRVEQGLAFCSDPSSWSSGDGCFVQKAVEVLTDIPHTRAMRTEACS